MEEFLEQKLANFIKTFNTNKVSGKKNSLPFCIKLFSNNIIDIINLGYKYSDIYDYINLKSIRKISKSHWYETIKKLELTTVKLKENKETQHKKSIFDNLNSTKNKKTIEHDSMHTFNKY